MAYIYLITNLINNKKYVGKTTNTIKERWQEHCRDSKKKRCEKRPLYDAFNKYGIENFKIEELEYIEDDSKLSKREVYWIQELQTYGHSGYNATKGGDGTILYDYNEILELYNLGYSANSISEKLKCDPTTVRKVLRAHGIKPRGNSNMIDQFDLANNFIQTFDSAVEASQWLLNNGLATSKQDTIRGCIRLCCRGKKKSAYGYKWTLKNIPKDGDVV